METLTNELEESKIIMDPTQVEFGSLETCTSGCYPCGGGDDGSYNA